MTKTIAIAAAAFTLAAGFTFADITPAKAGGYGYYGGGHSQYCAVQVWNPHSYAYVTKYVPCY